MLYEWLRVFKYDGANFTDLSLDNQEDGKTVDLALTTTDYIYVGQYFPANNFYLNINTANASALGMNIEYYTGDKQVDSWQPVIDVLDSTSVAGVSLSRSGVVQFEPKRQEPWKRIEDTSEERYALEFNALTLYDLYWYRISFDADVDAGTLLNEITYSFTRTSQLNDIDCEIAQYYNAFEPGKTDWEDEIITASKLVVQDLKISGIVLDRGQILRFDELQFPAIWKTFELIYRNLGPSYNENRQIARDEYQRAMSVRNWTIDQNSDGHASLGEIQHSIRGLTR